MQTIFTRWGRVTVFIVVVWILLNLEYTPSIEMKVTKPVDVVEVVEPTFGRRSDLENECVAISSTKALAKLGLQVSPLEIARNHKSRNLGHEYEAAAAALPSSIRPKLKLQVILNRPSALTGDVLRELTEHGGLLLCLSTKRLLGDPNGSVTPDHSVYVRGVVDHGGRQYMVVDSGWGSRWGRKGVAEVPVSSLRELPYVYGLFIQRAGAPPVPRSIATMMRQRPFKVSYASGRKYMGNASGAVNSNRPGSREVNEFMDSIIATQKSQQLSY